MWVIHRNCSTSAPPPHVLKHCAGIEPVIVQGNASIGTDSNVTCDRHLRSCRGDVAVQLRMFTVKRMFSGGLCHMTFPALSLALPSHLLHSAILLQSQRSTEVTTCAWRTHTVLAHFYSHYSRAEQNWKMQTKRKGKVLKKYGAWRSVVVKALHY